jgi:hypothetical protein
MCVCLCVRVWRYCLIIPWENWESPTIRHNDLLEIKPQALQMPQRTQATAFSINMYTFCPVGQYSSVSTATHNGLDGPGIESRWGWDFPHLSRPALGPIQPPVQWVLCLFPVVKAAGSWIWLHSPHPTPTLKEWVELYEGCTESIQLLWKPREPVAWPWCNLAVSQRRPYCASVNSHSPVGIVRRQWDAVDWACVLYDRRIQNSPPFQRRFSFGKSQKSQGAKSGL